MTTNQPGGFKSQPASSGSTPPSLQPRPMVPAVDPYDAIVANAKSLRDHLIQSSDPVEVQEGIVSLDRSLKRTAEVQSAVGAIRKTLGQHSKLLRQANPKGKPIEGTLKVLPSGSQVIFLGGNWQPYLGPPVVSEKEQEKP